MNFENSITGKDKSSTIFLVLVVFISILLVASVFLYTMSKKNHENSIDLIYYSTPTYFKDGFEKYCDGPMKQALVNYVYVKKDENGKYYIKCIYGPAFSRMNKVDGLDVYRGVVFECDPRTAKIITDELKNKDNPCAFPNVGLLSKNTTEYEFAVYRCFSKVLNSTDAEKMNKECGINYWNPGSVYNYKIYYIRDINTGRIFQ